MSAQHYLAECLPSSFVLEKRGSHTKETVEASRIATIKVVMVLAELEDNTSFMGTSASAVQTFMLYHRALFT